ncbi:ATP-binding cassette domain-containing protein [Lactobacillus paragasseri]|uniref:ABC transporter ATP-binding protein n=1 Tax=Lactobacillus paragasseri TaxID=2107999 RepID=UPI0012E25FE9|nr:ATP-binding cassette domain-containing protein [Lactobacillus paragasseri]MDK8085646.1 ATP-binding cassette domain-containing protein [Lactobacillus paragasseri]MDX5117589.1 ATP-binding cassette domain-containing protein [Lactobacillus paragasseri]MDX5121469.1 ATP-binding cassette domain-containing protein [Lactobacillus paragasseri]QGT97769.1 ATP-binding cassette domain-containing protein [Lactobacillus paragasseri]UWI46984.1 ATP-binding cassette domain-containing protein [Lactobacillus pa
MAILKLQNVAYQVGQKQILQNISFKIEDGAFLTLIGPSGAGKSTILKLIANLISPTSGKIFFREKDIMTIDPVTYRRSVSYCFQQPSLFGEKVADNLSFPYEIRKQAVDRERILRLLHEVSLEADYLDKDITSLSGGEKQRIALIRNLIFLPKVLLLDEVTTGLDGDNKAIIHQLIERVHQQGVTVIQVTHDQSEIDKAQNIIKIKKGGILE